MRVEFFDLAVNVGVGAFCGSLAIGALSGICGLVSKFVLPRLGYEAVKGIPLATINRHAFKTSAISLSIAASLAIVAFIILSTLRIGCGGGDGGDM